jgi:hypothetical protein
MRASKIAKAASSGQNTCGRQKTFLSNSQPFRQEIEKNGLSRAGKGKTGGNRPLNVSWLRKTQRAQTIQQRNHFRPDPIQSMRNVKNMAIHAT